MEILKSRYFFIACILSILFSTVSIFVLPIIKIIFIVIFIVLAGLPLVLYFLKRIRGGKAVIAILFCLSIVLSCISSYIYFDLKYSKEREIIGREVLIEGVIIDEQYNSSNLSGYTIKVESVNGKKKNYIAMLDCSYTSDVRPGDRIRAKVLATDFESNLQGYAQKQDKLAGGYYMSFESASEEYYEIIDTDVKNPRVILNRLNFKLSYKLRDAIGGETGNLASALLLGNKSELSDSTVRDFRRSGASHFLALSGLHMSILMGAISFALTRLYVPKKIRAGILIFISVFYLALTGFSVSATRSVIMLLYVYISMLLSYETDPLTNLSFAGALMLIISPSTALDVGFWMSFSATLGILSFMPIFEEIFERFDSKSKLKRFFKKLLAYVLGLFTTSVCATIGLILVICIFTKEYSVYSLLSSAVLSLPVTCIIVLSISLPFVYVIAPLSAVLIKLIQALSEFSLKYCSYVSHKENVMFSLDYSFLIYFAIAFAVVLVITLSVNFKRKYLVFLSYVPIILAFVLTVTIYNAANADKVTATYLNTSSNSDVIVLTNNGDTVICDLSNGSRKAYSAALEISDGARAEDIDIIILTDFHTAHISTLSRVFKSRIVRELWIPNPVDEDSYYRMISILDVAEQNRVKVKMFNTGNTLKTPMDVEITLNQSYIERSAVPISVLSIQCENDVLTYFSPAFTESAESDRYFEIINGSDYLIAGARGPKIKEYYSVGDGNKVVEFIIPDENIAAYFDATSLSDAVPIWVNTKNKNLFFTKSK